MRDYGGVAKTQVHEKPTARRRKEQETKRVLHFGIVKDECHDKDLISNKTIKPFNCRTGNKVSSNSVNLGTPNCRIIPCHRNYQQCH